MGYWSETIYGGDSPLDAAYNIETAIGASTNYNRDYLKPEPKFVKLFIKNIELAVDVCKRKNKDWRDNVHGLILGAITMSCGAPMSDDIKKMALKGVNDEIKEVANWGEADKRSFFLEDYKKKINEYDCSGGMPLYLSEDYVSDLEIINESITKVETPNFKI